jgi:hypothetical protein
MIPGPGERGYERNGDAPITFSFPVSPAAGQTITAIGAGNTSEFTGPGRGTGSLLT